MCPQHPNNLPERRSITLPGTMYEGFIELEEIAETRWIGRIPQQLRQVLDALCQAEWAYLSAQGIPIQIIPDSPESAAPTPEDESTVPSDEQIEQELSEIATWEQSPEGIAMMEKWERKEALQKKRREENETRFASWADLQANRYNHSVTTWWSEAARQIRVEVELVDSGGKHASAHERRLLATARDGGLRCDLSQLRAGDNHAQALRSALQHADEQRKTGNINTFYKWIDLASTSLGRASIDSKDSE